MAFAIDQVNRDNAVRYGTCVAKNGGTSGFTSSGSSRPVKRSPRAGEVLVEAVARGADVATSCSGAFLPAAVGLLDGRRATTSWWLAPLFRRLHPAVELDPEVSVAERWARARLAEDVSVGDVAAAAGMSTRTFARRVERATGLSPVRFLQRLRVETALDLLATTRLPVDEIARRVGYTDPTTLRRVLRRETGRSPRDLRGRNA